MIGFLIHGQSLQVSRWIVWCCNKYCSDHLISVQHYFTDIPFSYSSTADVGEWQCRSKDFRSAFWVKRLSVYVERWRILLECHTLNVYVFSLEQDTCVLIVVSRGTRNSVLLAFIKRCYLNETVATDLRYSPGICLDELTKNVRTANVIGHMPIPASPQKAAGAVS